MFILQKYISVYDVIVKILFIDDTIQSFYNNKHKTANK